jgi:hypothetical protein
VDRGRDLLVQDQAISAGETALEVVVHGLDQSAVAARHARFIGRPPPVAVERKAAGRDVIVHAAE